MSSSSVPLSLLAKGIGQVVTNGHEKLEVYLEPEDYYNLKSHSSYHVAALQHHDSLRHRDVGQDYVRPIPLHKTFVTRKGALLIFSEELANKAIAEEVQRLELKQSVKQKEKQWEETSETASEMIASDKGPDSLRTVNDLSLAILTYGNKSDYRRKGDDLYMRFIHESRAPRTERKIRPGYSPKRYIATWSKYWDDGMLQKLRSSGLVSDKTLYRQNPLLPHLYQPASYNLSLMPVPYRVTRNMLLAPGNVGTYDFQREKPGDVTTRRGFANEEELARKPKIRIRRDPPPSHEDSGELGVHVLHEPVPIGSIQAVKFLDTGEIQEVKYSELKPQEKQEILAELLATAWEHGKHIEETLDLVLSSNKPRARSGASSSAASELMVDMHRAILSLVESPVRKQIQDRQRLLQLEEEKRRKRQEHEDVKKERKRMRKQQEIDREAEKLTKQTKIREAGEQTRIKEKKRAEENAKKKEVQMQEDTAGAEEQAEVERREREKRRQEKLEERERRRQARQDAKRKKEELRQALNEEEEERIRLQHEEDKRRTQLQEDEAAARKDERRKQRQERKQKKEEERARAEEERRKRHKEKDEQRRRHNKEKELQDEVGHEDNEWKVPAHTRHIVATVPAPPDETSLSTSQQRAVALQGSAPMPQVPNNTPATEPRKARIQRQIPLENVIAEAQTKGYADSASLVSSGSSKKSIPPGTLFAAGDGKFARVSLGDVHTNKVRRHSKPIAAQPLVPIVPHSPRSHASEQSSGPRSNMFPAELPGDIATQRRSSFYGGAMPITSNIVKQTLSDNVSILSASQGTTGSKKYENYASSGHPSAPQKDFDDYNEGQYDVPVIGIEPPTPMQHNLFSTPVSKGALPTMIPDENYLSPAASESTKSKRSSRKLSRRPSYGDYDVEHDDKDDIESSNSSKSKTLQKADEQSSITGKSSKTKKTYSSGKSNQSSSKWLKADSAIFAGGNVESTYRTLKGTKGPGSQSSAATFSKTSSSKKSSSVRGSLPSSMRSQGKAVVFMPDGEIVNVGGKVESLLDESTAEESTEEADVSRTEKSESPKPVLKKPSLQSNSLASEPEIQPPSRKVSFKEDMEKTETTTESEEEDGSEWEESEKEDADWPQHVAEQDADSRSVSSRSEKLTQHAQKIAKLVVQTQRPESRLEEDASEGAKLWNQLAEEKSGAETEEDEDSESDEETEEETAEDQDDAFKAAIVEQEKKETLEKEQREKENREKLVKAAAEKKKAVAAKEITARAPAPAKKVGPSSIQSFKSTSSVKSSISSIQEAFVSEVQRKASELGVKESDLIFDADVVEKVSKSSIDPNDIEVVHDIEAGQHIVRSRRSSVTVSSYHTSASEPSTQSDLKKKLVIDMPLQENVPLKTVSPRRSISTVTSTTASPTSPTRFQTPMSRSSSVTSKRKSSIPVDATGVALDYGLTSYEGKLGDPKPEEPLILSGRPPVEPEKIKDAVKAGTEKEQGKDKQKERNIKGGKDEAKKTAAEMKAGKKQGEQLKTESKAEKDNDISEEEKLKRDLAKITEGQKKITKKAEAKKPKRKKAAAVEEQPETRSPEKLTVKTPETPFVTGRMREKIIPEEPHSTPSSRSSKLPVKDVKKTEKPKSKKEPKTQVELENNRTKSKKKSKEEPKEDSTETGTVKKRASLVPVETLKQAESPEEEEKEDLIPELPVLTPEDTYEFIRVEDSPAPSEPEPESKPAEEEKQDDAKSHTSEVTEGTEKTDGTEGDQKSAQDDDFEREAKMATKREREAKRAAAADKRRLDVERKRKEKEDQLRKEKEEQERQEQLKEEFEAEKRRREEVIIRRREEVAKEKERERQEEELKKKREEQQREREKRLQEEHKKKMEELQRKKKEDEAKKVELARIEAEEAELRRKEEEEMLSQMAEDERIEYERQKREGVERKRIEVEERRKRDEEQARIAMEQARIQALILAKQQAALEEKLKFVREFLLEANGLDQTQNVNRAFSFSYFELLQLLGLDFKDIE